MNIRHAVPDPPEISDRLWEGFAGRTGWDVGMNCGQSLIEMSWSFEHLVGFEPDPRSFAEAADHARRFLPAQSMRFYQMALSDADGELKLAYPAAEQKETGQLVTPGTDGMEWQPEDWDKVETVTVPCRTADSVAAELGWPDFMKVDTEGHEVKVLCGATSILARGATDLLVEFHSPQNHVLCGKLLAGAGYRIELIRHPHYWPDSHMWQQHGWLKAWAPGGKK